MSEDFLPPTAITQWRRQTLKRVLWWAVRLGGLLASLLLIRLLYVPDPSVVQFSSIAVFCLLPPLAWREMSYTARAWGTVLLFSVMGLSAIMTIGLVPGPVLTLSLSVLLGAVFLGREAILVLLTASSLCLLGIGLGFEVGLPQPQQPAPPLPDWLISCVGYTVVTGISAVMVWDIITRLEQALSLSELEQQRAVDASDELIQALKQLQKAQRLESLGRLAGGVAHDFNNALQIILGWVHLLPRGQNADTDEAIDSIERAATSAAGLTRQLLAFSRQQPPHREVVAVTPLVERWSQTLQRLLSTDHTLKLELSETPPVCADGALLQQALLNLVTNAREASAPGDTITIGTRSVSREAVQKHVPGCQGPDVWGHIWVRDEGCGIPLDLQDRIFEPFFTTRGERGHGLGLSMVYSSVRQSSGHVTVSSAPEAGTTFHIFLPAHAQALTVPSEAAAGAEPPLQGQVLLAEDEPDIRHLMAAALRGAGLSVTEVGDGDAAATALASSAPTLLCIDAVMPGQPTWEVIARYRAQNPNGKVLVCSGHLRDPRIAEAIEREALPYLAKPFTPPELIARIRALLA